MPGLTIRAEGVEGGTAKFDLLLSVEEGKTGWEMVLEYRTDLFERESMEAMLGHYERLLREVLAEPEREVRGVELLSEREREQLAGWNRTERRYEAERVDELIARQAEKTPKAEAVICGEKRLTYEELESAANRLAHHLRGMGVGPEVLVGVCLERSVEMVVALLGVLKAGGAYVPLDPSYPRERLAYMLEDSGAAVVISEKKVAAQLESTAGLVLLDEEHLEGLPAKRLASLVEPENTAYVIYTS